MELNYKKYFNLLYGNKTTAKFKKYRDLVVKCILCDRCFLHDKKLCLPGTGNIDIPSGYMFIGEAPSVYRTHFETFGMRSKQIFEKMLSVLGITRNTCWATNVVKCILPRLRPGDYKKCRDFLLEEISILKPRIIVTLGRIATRALLQHDFPLGGYHTVIRIGDEHYSIYTCYHPMVAIYDPEKLSTLLTIMRKIKSEADKNTGLMRWL